MTELDLIDKSKLEHMIQDAYTNFSEQFSQMSIKQKTNYFVSMAAKLSQIINTVLMSVCHCLISGSDQDMDEPNNLLGVGMIKKAFRYQL